MRCLANTPFLKEGRSYLGLALVVATLLWALLIGTVPSARQDRVFLNGIGMLSDSLYPRICAEQTHPYAGIPPEEMAELVAHNGWGNTWVASFCQRIGRPERENGWPESIKPEDACYPPAALDFMRLFPCSSGGILACTLIGSVFLLMALLLCRNQSSSRSLNLLIVSLAFSSPMLYSIERGQLLPYAAAGVALFIGSSVCPQNRRLRFAGLLGLAVASVLKISPALLALELVRTRRWRDLTLFIALSAILFFAPFAWHDGFSGFGQWLANAGENATVHARACAWGFVAVDRTIRAACGFPTDVAWTFMWIGRLMSALVGLALIVRWWKSRDWFLILAALLLLAGNMHFYTGLYLLPALVIRKWSPADLILWFLILCPLQLPFGSGSIMRQLSNLAFLTLAFKSLIWPTEKERLA